LLGRLDIAQSTLSHHMKVLADAGLVDVERSGKWTHYSINGVTVDKLDRFVNSLRSDRSLRARRARAAAMVALEEVERGPVEEVHN
jgi:DNA-binding transcriptional ArsR family regulator